MLRPKVMLAVLGLVAVSALFAFSAYATAFEWGIEGEPLKGKQALKEKATVNENEEKSKTVDLKWGAKEKQVEVRCEGTTLKNGEVLEGFLLNENLISWLMCSASNGKTPEGGEGCKVVSEKGEGKIETTALKGTLEETKTGFAVKHAPAEGSTIAKFKLTGEKCAVAGSYTVEGTATSEFEEAKTSARAHALNFTKSSSALTIAKEGSSKETLELVANFSVELASEHKWEVL